MDTTDQLDVTAVERAESEIDNFISKRAREKKDANAVEELWKASERRDRDRRRRENRTAWYSFHEHMRTVHQDLADEHRVRAEALCSEPGEVAS